MRPDNQVIKCDEALLEGRRGKKTRKGQKRGGWGSEGEKEGKEGGCSLEKENTLA